MMTIELEPVNLANDDEWWVSGRGLRLYVTPIQPPQKRRLSGPHRSMGLAYGALEKIELKRRLIRAVLWGVPIGGVLIWAFV